MYHQVQLVPLCTSIGSKHNLPTTQISSVKASGRNPSSEVSLSSHLNNSWKNKRIRTHAQTGLKLLSWGGLSAGVID